MPTVFIPQPGQPKSREAGLLGRPGNHLKSYLPETPARVNEPLPINDDRAVRRRRAAAGEIEQHSPTAVSVGSGMYLLAAVVHGVSCESVPLPGWHVDLAWYDLQADEFLSETIENRSLYGGEILNSIVQGPGLFELRTKTEEGELTAPTNKQINGDVRLAVEVHIERLDLLPSEEQEGPVKSMPAVPSPGTRRSRGE